MQWGQSVLGAAAAEPSLREGDWDPGTCLFILYPFSMVVTKANALQVQSLENMDKTKEETDKNLSPGVNLFYASFQSFFCMYVCTRVHVHACILLAQMGPRDKFYLGNLFLLHFTQ